MNSKCLFLTPLLLLCLIDTGSSEDGMTFDVKNRRCHQCNSHEQPHCDDPFHHTDDFLDDCPNDGKEYFCRKIYQNVRGVESVIRSCGYIKDEREDRQCYTTVLEEYNTLVCQCDTDGCNSASRDKVSKVAVVSAVLLAWLMH
eukprot:GFUD01036110.1.p1 GENE.GFUD01036110.1~~GFUD01036110.1.p1  ORF type:complete len:143 (-),score=23.34 GFUD01036110.1:278-706(-)